MIFAILHFYNFILVIDTTVQNNDKEISLHFNPLNAELNPLCHLLTLLGAHLIFHISRIRVKQTVCTVLSVVDIFFVVVNFYASVGFSFLCGTRKCEKSALLCGKSVE